MRVIHLLRKPPEDRLAVNVPLHGCGALHIRGIRIPTTESTSRRLGHNAYQVQGGRHGSLITAGQEGSKHSIEVRKHRPDWREIAVYLREHREALGLSRNAMGELLGVGATYYWWEGKGRLPSPEAWLRLKDALGFDDTFDQVMTETETVHRTMWSGGIGGRWPSNLILEHHACGEESRFFKQVGDP